jgi:hypothetical protein
MTIEEALEWCIEHHAQVDFTTHEHLHWVRVYLWREGGKVDGAGYTLIEAVEAAIDFVRPEPTA